MDKIIFIVIAGILFLLSNLIYILIDAKKKWLRLNEVICPFRNVNCEGVNRTKCQAFETKLDSIHRMVIYDMQKAKRISKEEHEEMIRAFSKPYCHALKRYLGENKI